MNTDLLVESPMFRYECCKHCRGYWCPKHDGHAGPCHVPDCKEGTLMIGELK